MTNTTKEPIHTLIDEDNSYNFRQLMDALTLNGELIVTIAEDQVGALKAGLIMRKSKDNRKMVRSGLIPLEKNLSFFVYAAKDKNGKTMDGIVSVRIALADKKTIDILSIEVPDNEL